MSKKRKREVDLELVQVYEHLADDNEDIRLRAAHTLVAKIFKPGVTSDDQTTTILNRLFRGLCSSRKSARLGFSVALTELLSQLSLAGDLPAASLVDILETQTVPEGGTSSQDERDHYFGRVFGAGAVLKSGFLFRKPNPDQWKRVLDLICDLAIKKPWLRQECGWVVLTSIASGGPDVPEQFAIDSVEVLVANKLIRTPEGLAIWLTTARLFPHAKLPKSVWKHGDPLATKDVNLLADILKDARSQSQADAESEAQGSARWSAALHFAWDVVLGELFRDSGPASHNGSHNGLHSVTDKNGRVTFALFWQKAVDGMCDAIAMKLLLTFDHRESVLTQEQHGAQSLGPYTMEKGVRNSSAQYAAVYVHRTSHSLPCQLAQKLRETPPETCSESLRDLRDSPSRWGSRLKSRSRSDWGLLQGTSQQCLVRRFR
jgi:DNA polymerase phi